jgi:polyphosphate kinase
MSVSFEDSTAGAAPPNDAPPSGSVSLAEFLNRELSWLEFNRRVLHEALDERTPVLERVRFLGIFTSNLDEFFMKRVGGLKRQVAAGVVSRTPDGLTPAEQLAAIRRTVLPMLVEQAEGYTHQVRPALARSSVYLLEWKELTAADHEAAGRYFRTNVFPVLTPLAVDPGHPFPFISNLSTSLGVTLRHPDREEPMFARVKVPEVLPAWVPLETAEGTGTYRFVSLMDMIRANLDALFPDMAVVNVMPFRLTRNADVEREEEDADDLLSMIEQELRRRRFEKVVRLEHGPAPDRWMLRFLMQELGLSDADVYELSAELNYADLAPIVRLPIPGLKHEPWTPQVPTPLADEDADIFSAIRRGDLLIHHPYESFGASVERFVRAAAADPDVLAIKMTLYRTGDDSPFIRTLIEASEAGKQVVCLVELKARFDEGRNIYWAQALEKAGVHVVYGVVGLKTHTKTTLVVRREPEGLRCYAHVGTGNYHVETAKLYTDLSLLTASPDLTEDLVELFNYLTGRSLKHVYRKLLVAPINMKEAFLGRIEREIGHRQAGRPARIIAKMNSLEDRSIVRALYRASQAGVPIDLIVRGFCCLKPGVPGLSENIRVMSVIGRFLEHSRLFWFQNGAADPLDGEFFIGSADWMYRNLLARVEAVAPIEARPCRQTCWEILEIMLRDHRQAWDMKPDGSYVQRTPPPGAESSALAGTHQALMDLARKRWSAEPAAAK